MVRVFSLFLVLMSLGLAHAQDSPMLSISLNSNPKDIMNTSLRIAAREGRLVLVREYLNRGADPNAMGSFSETALQYASRWNHLPVVEQLLKAGADPDLRDYRNETPLMQSSLHCSHRIAGALIKGRANVNLVNREGKNALIFAAANGCEKIVENILSNPLADPNVVDDAGYSALDYAIQEAQLEVNGPYTRIARAIRKSGGKTKFFEIPVIYLKLDRQEGSGLKPVQ